MAHCRSLLLKFQHRVTHSWAGGVPAAAFLDVRTCDKMVTGLATNAEAVSTAKTDTRQATTHTLKVRMSIPRLSPSCGRCERG